MLRLLMSVCFICGALGGPRVYSRTEREAGTMERCCSVQEEYITKLQKGMSQHIVRCDFEAEMTVDEDFNATKHIPRKILINQCNFLCQLKLENMVDERNLTKADECQKFIEKNLEDGDMKQKLVAANAKCVEFSNVQAELQKNSIEKKKICSPSAIFYVTCLLNHIELFCPEESLSKSKHCINEIKQIKHMYDE